MLSKKEIMIISIRTERMFERLNIKRNFKAYLFSLIFFFLSFYIFGIIDNNKVLKIIVFLIGISGAESIFFIGHYIYNKNYFTDDDIKKIYIKVASISTLLTSFVMTGLLVFCLIFL